MNCTTCKNPINDNSTTCEWCGCTINNNIQPDSKHLDDLEKQIINAYQMSDVVKIVELFKRIKNEKNLNQKEAGAYVNKVLSENGVILKKGCFIATACYGDYDAPEVLVLRRYRDDILLNSTVGRLFVSTYYRISPPIAELISHSNSTKRVIRKYLLSPIIKFINK